MEPRSPVQLSTRANDFMYDPNFSVSSEKDFNKHAYKASLATAQLEIAPVFSNMFSDLRTCPRQTIVMKVDHTRAEFIKRSQRNSSSILFSSQPVDICGADRAKYFKLPIITLKADILLNNNLELEIPKQPSHKNKIVQTIYRESSAQTTPWKNNNYVIVDGSDPEILKLNFLKENIPPGMHEVDIIRCARKRRAWENLLPEVEDAATLEKRRQILEAIEIEQWVFREKEIEAIQMLRMELLERMLEELLNDTKNRTEKKLSNISKRLLNEKNDKMEKMKHKSSRELRRLYRLSFGINTKYKTRNIIEEYADYKSEVYAPQMRFGEHPKRGHAKIKLLNYEPVLHDVEYMSTLPKWIYNNKLVNANEIKLPGRRLCIRETKWTEPVLKQLHKELLGFHTSIKYKCTLRVKKAKDKILDKTAHMFDTDSLDDEVMENEAVIILQSIIRGRAAQTLIYEGRDRCRELIEELQYTHFLDIAQNAEMRKKRLAVLGQQRSYEVNVNRQSSLEDALNKLQGSVVGTMLDFLSKELIRIMDERKAHALALMYERERRDKEAAEAGRRQVEERQRREHDEMFRQVVKVDQDTVDLYLRDIITEGIEKVADDTAKKYVTTLAIKIEEEAKNPPITHLDKEELIANMVCQFLIPEAEKTRIRNNIKQKQKRYLRCAHDIIYNKIETLTKMKNEDHDVCLDKSSVEMKLPSVSGSSSTENKEEMEEEISIQDESEICSLYLDRPSTESFEISYTSTVSKESECYDL